MKPDWCDEPANDWITQGSGYVFKDLGLPLPTREEWTKLCQRHGSTARYPFADVVPFAAIRSRIPTGE